MIIKIGFIDIRTGKDWEEKNAWSKIPFDKATYEKYGQYLCNTALQLAMPVYDLYELVMKWIGKSQRYKKATKKQKVYVPQYGSAFVMLSPEEVKEAGKFTDARECAASAFTLWTPAEYEREFKITFTDPRECPASIRARQEVTVSNKPLTGKELISKVNSLKGHLRAVKEKYGISPNKVKKSKVKPHTTINKGITPRDLRNARGER